MRTLTATGRRAEIDALRVLACFMVICIHVIFEAWHVPSVKSFAWQCLNLCNSFVRGCVPVFAMISGIHFLREEKPISVLFRKYILRMFLIYLLWVVLYAVDEVGLRALRSAEGLEKLFRLCAEGKYHLWYLACTVGAYLLVPLLWCVARWKDGKYLKYLCYLFLLASALQIVAYLLPKRELFLTAYSLLAPGVTAFPMLMLLGYYVYEKGGFPWSNGKCLVLFFVTVLLTAAANGALSWHKGEPLSDLLGNFSFSSVFEGLCLLILFRNIGTASLFTGHSRLWLRLSSCTLGIYLIHVFVLEHLASWFSIDVSFAPLPVSLPALAVGVFLISLAVVALLRRIPFVGKWIV